MTILTAKNTPRVTYTATSGQTDFTIPFEFFSTDDIKVYNGTTLLTYNASPSSTSQYSITGTASASDSAYEFGSGGTVSIGSTGATTGDIITIIRDIVIERSTDFPTSGTFDITSLNTDLDKIYAKLADIDQQSDRSVKLLDTDSISATVTLPAKASRQDKVLTFDSSGNAVTTIASTDVTTIAGISSDVTTVSGIASNVTTVAGISSNVTTVASNNSNVNTVAGISSDVTTVAGISSNVTAVAGDATDIGTVAGSISNVNTVAAADSNISTVASANSNISTVAGSITNVNTVATNMSGVNDFADRYRVVSSDPTSNNDTGDLIYNTTSNSLKVYESSSFTTINTAGGIANVSDDTTPQLGGNLDANSNNITNLGTINTHTIPSGTDTLVGRATTDTLTNKTINTASNTITIVEADISDLGSYITASSTDTLTNKSGNISMFTNDSNFITSTVTGDFTVDTSTLKVDSTNNRVGIGTASPSDTFVVAGSGSVHQVIKCGNNTGNSELRFGDSDSDNPGVVYYVHSDNSMRFNTGGAEEMRLENDGDLHVDGDVIAFSTTVSDVALKSNIEMIPNALDKIDEVRGVTFTRHNGQKSAGIIAQELEKVLPEAVRQKKLALHDGKEYKTVEYDAIHGLLINCIKELKQEIKDLKNGFTK